MTTGLVLHALGDPDGGAAWRDALAGTPGCASWAAPDLPGHGSAPAPRNGAYDPMGAVTWARRHISGLVTDEMVVIGVGENAHAALVLAAGGGCHRVVMVDGLHGPFRTPTDEVRAMYATLRAIVSDPGATAPAPERGLDPRTTYGYGVSVSAPFLERFWGSISIPVLAIETPASPTPPAERAARMAWFGGPSALVEVADVSARSVVGVVASQPPLERLP